MPEYPEIIWGVQEIATALGLRRRQVYHMLENDALPGAMKVGGKWCFRPDLFYAAFDKSKGDPND